MKKILTAALAALTLGGAAMATATPADAAPWHGGGGRGYYGGYHGGGYGGYRGGYGGYRGGYGWGGGALVAGLAGLAVGAAIAEPHYYAPPAYYGYARPYGYYGYGTCYANERVWDPYVGDYVIERTRYAC
ncbi:MAG: hypothetical protein P4L64_16100 [Caulobacteraceae bacterium]|nr:hypothetical protein [Caulobacteraceae bacterium]